MTLFTRLFDSWGRMDDASTLALHRGLGTILNQNLFRWYGTSKDPAMDLGELAGTSIMFAVKKVLVLALNKALN